MVFPKLKSSSNIQKGGQYIVGPEFLGAYELNTSHPSGDDLLALFFQSEEETKFQLTGSECPVNPWTRVSHPRARPQHEHRVSLVVIRELVFPS